MISIIALEELIKENDQKASFLQKQLSEHEEGLIKLSKLSLVTTEAKLEESRNLLRKYKKMYEEITQQDGFNRDDYEKEVKIKEAAQRQKYFERQNERIQSTFIQPEEQRLEAVKILDELPIEVKFEDEQLFDLAMKTSELNLFTHEELFEKLLKITNDFKKLLRDIKEENINELQMLNYRIPILVLHFSTLFEVILKNHEIMNEKRKEKKQEQKIFSGFPKYEDWWIKELWSSHQAYFALYKWKEIISTLCLTKEQKKSWGRIFDNWVSVKKLLSDKEELAFEYNFAFDSLLFKYAQVEEELDTENLKSMDAILKEITKKEDFTKVIREHEIKTNYSQFKEKKLK